MIQMREGNEPTLLLIVSQLVECCKMGDARDDAGNIITIKELIFLDKDK